MLTLTKKNQIETPSDQELLSYARRVREAKFAHAFTSPKDFDEIKYLTEIIEERSTGIERLIRGLNLNSSIMTHSEVETWKKQFELMRNDLILHKNLAKHLFPNDFFALK